MYYTTEINCRILDKTKIKMTYSRDIAEWSHHYLLVIPLLRVGWGMS